MSNFPEMSLEPPEDIIACFCHVCGGEIYEGCEYWEYEGKPLCYEHLTEDVAEVIGAIKKDGREFVDFEY